MERKSRRKLVCMKLCAFIFIFPFTECMKEVVLQGEKFGKCGNCSHEDGNCFKNNEMSKVDEVVLLMQKALNAKASAVEAAFVPERSDCSDVAGQGFNTSGVYKIVVGGRIVSVYCDFETDGGRWLIIQRRGNGLLNFLVEWDAYSNGFGNVQEEFWLGLENIHQITVSRSYKLRIDLEDWENNKAHAYYSFFSVGDSSTNYSLNIEGYSGTAGDSLNYHNHNQFSTREHDNDASPYNNCAQSFSGGWWFNRCAQSNLNGGYRVGGEKNFRGIFWLDWRDRYYSLKRVEMKIGRN